MVRRSAGSNDKPRPPTKAGSAPVMCSVGEGKGFAVVTNEEMEVVLRQIGWSNAELARRLDIHELTVREMLAGRRRIPENLVDLAGRRGRGTGAEAAGGLAVR
jgi:hypothetical protein